jgi:hypothetical protein
MQELVIVYIDAECKIQSGISLVYDFKVVELDNYLLYEYF